MPPSFSFRRCWTTLVMIYLFSFISSSSFVVDGVNGEENTPQNETIIRGSNRSTEQKDQKKNHIKNRNHDNNDDDDDNDHYDGNMMTYHANGSTRSERFPSIEERVKLYMSNWYIPPCDDYIDGHVLYNTIDNMDNNDNQDPKQKQQNNDKKVPPPPPPHKKITDPRWPSLQIQTFRNHPLIDNPSNNNDNDDDDDDEEKDSVATTSSHPNDDGRTIMRVESVVEPDMTFFLDPTIIVNCANETHYELYGEDGVAVAAATKNEDDEEDEEEAVVVLPLVDPMGVAKRTKFRINMKMYCADIKQLMLPVLSHLELDQRRRLQKQQQQQQLPPPPPPTLLQFGDNKQSHVFGDVMVPHIKKFRSSALSPQELAKVTTLPLTMGSNSNNHEEKACYATPRPALRSKHGDGRFQPIVWKLATDRHYKKLYQIYREDTPWYKKKDMAIFRGQLTGSRDGYDKELSDEQNCHNLKRCRLVYDHANSTLIDARLTSTRERLPSTLNGVPLLGDKVRVYTLLEYKGIIMIEGNDVASGLKWALLSQSVVLMPSPKHTSWAMEELLQPWVHYVPLNDFATNVEERMQWVLDNEEEAQRISERATLWMEDLVFHPDAAEDDRLIQEEIMRRYQRHFLPADTTTTAT